MIPHLKHLRQDADVICLREEIVEKVSSPNRFSGGWLQGEERTVPGDKDLVFADNILELARTLLGNRRLDVRHLQRGDVCGQGELPSWRILACWLAEQSATTFLAIVCPLIKNEDVAPVR